MGVGSESKTNHLQETFFRIGFTIKNKSFLEKLFWRGQMDFAVLFLWGSDGLWGAFFAGVRWTLGCFFCGGQMDFGVLFLWGSDGLWGAFFVVVRWTLRCFFCGGQMDFAVLFLWGSDGLWGAFFVGVRWTLGRFFLLCLFSTEATDGLGKTNLAGSLVFVVLFLWGSVVLF